MSLSAKISLFALGGAAVVGGALLATGVIGDGIFGNTSNGGDSALPEETTSIVYEVELPSEPVTNTYLSETLIPFGETHLLGDRLAGVFANPNYVLDTDGNLYSATDCRNVLVSASDMSEQYCFDNAFVYRDHGGIYHVVTEGTETGTFSGVNGKPIGVYNAASIFDETPLLHVLSHGDDNRLYLSSFTQDGAVFRRANTVLDCYFRDTEKRVKTFDFISCSARDDGLLVYAISDGEGMSGTVTGTYETNYRFDNNTVTLYSFDISTYEPSQFVDISGYFTSTLYWDRQHHSASFYGCRDVPLPDGAVSDSVRQMLLTDGTPIVLLDNGQVWCGYNEEEWRYCEALSAYGVDGHLLQLFKMTNPDYAYNNLFSTERSDKLIVMLDDCRLYEVAIDAW